MLLLSNTLLNQQVLSLRTGGQVATAIAPIINPNNLHVEGFYCDDRFSKRQLILLAQDIREHFAKGFVINDHEVLADPTELVRLEKVLKIQFVLIGKQVVTVGKQKLGKVCDYAVEDKSLYVQKLYITPRLLKSISGGNLMIDRTQIIEITDSKIIVEDILKPIRSPAAQPLPA